MKYQRDDAKNKYDKVLLPSRYLSITTMQSIIFNKHRRIQNPFKKLR